MKLRISTDSWWVVPNMTIVSLKFGIKVPNRVRNQTFTISIFLVNLPCMIRPTLVGLNPDEYNQVLRCYPFMVNSDKCNDSCNTFDNPSNRACVPNRKENVNLNNKNNMMRRRNESKY